MEVFRDSLDSSPWLMALQGPKVKVRFAVSWLPFGPPPMYCSGIEALTSDFIISLFAS
jgi:hypothetical protein